MRIQVTAPKAKPHSTELIKNAKCKMIVTMGELAALTVLQSTETLTKLRGQIHEFCGAKLVPTYDVTHLLINAQDKAATWRDLCLAMEAVQ